MESALNSLISLISFKDNSLAKINLVTPKSQKNFALYLFVIFACMVSGRCEELERRSENEK